MFYEIKTHEVFLATYVVLLCLYILCTLSVFTIKMGQTFIPRYFFNNEILLIYSIS